MRRDEHAMIAKSPRVTRTTADAVNTNEECQQNEYSTDRNHTESRPHSDGYMKCQQNEYSTDRNHTESRPHSDGYISNYLC